MSNIVPFGKYKGQPVEVLKADEPYCQWLSGQDWFRSRFAPIYQVIIQGPATHEDTPEHNRIQAKFLEDDFLDRFAGSVIGRLDLRNKLVSEWIVSSKRLEFRRSNASFEQKELFSSWIKLISRTGFDPNGAVELDWASSGATFETKDGWDVVFSTDVYLDDLSETVRPLLVRELTIFVEIKPSIGDDFPNVLRQVKARNLTHWRQDRREIYVVFAAQWTGEGVTSDQCTEIFLRSGILLVLSDLSGAA